MEMHMVRIRVDRANDRTIANAEGIHEDIDRLLEIVQQVVALLHAHDEMLDDAITCLSILHQ